MTTCGKAAGIRVKMRSRARKEASAQEVRGYFKQYAEAQHLEWVDNEVFDLIDMRKVKPKNYVTGRWALTTKTDKQGNFLKAKARWVLRGYQDKRQDYKQTDSPASTRQGFRMSCQIAASKDWDLFHIDLKTAFLQGQSDDVNLVRHVDSETSTATPEAEASHSGISRRRPLNRSDHGYCCQTEETSA